MLLSISTPHASAVSLLAICSREIKTDRHNKTGTHVIIASLLIVNKNTNPLEFFSEKEDKQFIYTIDR